MGEFNVVLSEIEPYEVLNSWFILNPMKKDENEKTESLGEIRLAMKYTETTLLPRGIYEEMNKVIIFEILYCYTIFHLFPNIRKIQIHYVINNSTVTDGG